MDSTTISFAHLALALLLAVLDAEAPGASGVRAALGGAALAATVRVANPARLGALGAVGNGAAASTAVRDAEASSVCALGATIHLAEVSAAVLHAQSLAASIVAAVLSPALGLPALVGRISVANRAVLGVHEHSRALPHAAVRVARQRDHDWRRSLERRRRRVDADGNRVRHHRGARGDRRRWRRHDGRARGVLRRDDRVESRKKLLLLLRSCGPAVDVVVAVALHLAEVGAPWEPAVVRENPQRREHGRVPAGVGRADGGLRHGQRRQHGRRPGVHVHEVLHVDGDAVGGLVLGRELGWRGCSRRRGRRP